MSYQVVEVINCRTINNETFQTIDFFIQIKNFNISNTTAKFILKILKLEHATVQYNAFHKTGYINI